MIHIYGKTTCTICKKETRTLLEIESTEEAFLVLGDEGEKEWEQQTHQAECEYCFHPNTVNVVIQENRISAFANQEEYASYKNGSLQVSSAKKGKGIQDELVADDFHVYFSLSFAEQPLAVGSVLEVESKKWTVIRSFKKEHVEQDWQKRLEVDFYDTYYYEVKNEKGQYKWIEVIDDNEGENATLSEEGPIALPHESLYDISESNAKSAFLWEQEFGVQYTVRAYQHISGIQMVVYRKDEEGNLIVLDALGEDVDSLYREIEGLLYINE